MKRGFVTVATGKYYCWLAQNLYMSYKLFSNCNYPFYVITDEAGERRLKKIFDGVILIKNPSYGFLDKLLVYFNSPFDETIFMDADMNIAKDISDLFDDFMNNGSELSCIGTIKHIDEMNKPNHFNEIAIRKYGFNEYISFGGGIYYYKRSQKVADCIKYIIDDEVPHYKEYGLVYLTGGKMMDEACYEVGMLKFEFWPLSTEKEIMRFHKNMMPSFKWDLDLHDCSFEWWNGIITHPSIVHYATHNTYFKKYVYYNALVRGMYKNTKEYSAVNDAI